MFCYLKLDINWYLQSGEDQQYGEVDLYDHVNIVLDKEPCNEADGEESGCGDEYCQDVADDRSAQIHLYSKSSFSMKPWSAHLYFAQCVLG